MKQYISVAASSKYFSFFSHMLKTILLRGCCAPICLILHVISLTGKNIFKSLEGNNRDNKIYFRIIWIDNFSVFGFYNKKVVVKKKNNNK